MKYFITGGTGSLGSKLVEYITKNEVDEVIVFSRDEQKQFNMKVKYTGKPNRIHYVLGDVRDYETVDETLSQYRPEVVIHTAAQKHVQECDTNPMQAVKTNIEGTKNIGKACIVNGVDVACFISTDKAPDPTTLYGMTKHIAERLWVNFAKRQQITRFTGVRYGNILNSVGSLIPLYQKLAKQSGSPEFPLTSGEMTRFFLTYPEAIALIMHSLGINYIPYGGNFANLEKIVAIHSKVSKMFIIPVAIAARVGDIAEIFAEVYNGKVIHIDAVEGEKIHEILSASYCSKDHVISKEAFYKLLQTNGIVK